MLQSANLSVERDARRVFENLSFTVRSGQAAHVSGANGAGKTTLLRTLCGLIRPESGDIRFEGAAITEDIAAYLRCVAYVGHENGLKAEFTPLENLNFEKKIRAAPRKPSGPRILKRLGIGHCADVPCRYLSAGQKRRAALARLLACDARLWLLDEPLTGLDADGRQLFAELLAEHLGKGGCAVVTSHQPFESSRGDFVELPLENFRAG